MVLFTRDEEGEKMTYRPESPTPGDDTRYRDRLDPKYIFNTQIQRCLQTVDTPAYAPHVMALARLLPTASRDLIHDKAALYTDKEPRWHFMTYQGYKIGTKEEPMLRDKTKPIRMKNKKIDWTDPNIYSPTLDTDPDPINPDRLFEMILEEAEARDLLWSTEDYSKIDYLNISKVSKKNPRRPQ